MPRELGARSGIWSVALAASVLTIVTLMIVVFLPQVPAANPNVESSSLGSSSVSISSNPTTVQSAVQAAAAQYPLVWAPKTALSGCDLAQFCIDATLAFPGHEAANNNTSTTTITGGNATTIVISSTTTIIRTNGTAFVYPIGDTSYPVAAIAFVQDAVTGQNVTTGEGHSLIANSCFIQPAGFSHCYIGGNVPPGHTYKVTVFITKTYLPCSLHVASVPCTSELLAPPSPPFTVTVPP